MAEELVGTEPAVAVEGRVELGEPPLEIGAPTDEAARQLPGDEVEELVRLHGARHQVRSGDERDAAGHDRCPAVEGERHGLRDAEDEDDGVDDERLRVPGGARSRRSERPTR